MGIAQHDQAPRALWPVDKLLLANSTILVCLLAKASFTDARALLFIAAHALAVVCVVVLARKATGFWDFVRHWFVLIYLPLCYKEVPYLVTVLRLQSTDFILAGWDKAMWRVDPVFWLSAHPNPWIVEILQLVYTMFIPGVVALGIVLWLRTSRAEFRYGAFLLAATFLISYLGYLVLPARGPRLLPYSVMYPPLRGLWTFPFLQRLLDSLEGVQYDCFPSGHVAVVLVGCYIARRISAPVFWFFTAFAALITISTVYLRYHYVIDLIAGTVLAIVIMGLSPWIYRKLGGIQEPV